MIARTFASVALAGAVVLAPTAAFAETYPAPEDALTCSATVVDQGQTFDCTVEGPNGASAQLQTTTSGDDATIAGTVTSAPKTIVNNVAEFTVTAPGTAGVIGISAIINGEAIDTASVDVVAADAAADDELSSTGFENAGLAIGAGVLLVAGATTVFVAGRRRANANA